MGMGIGRRVLMAGTAALVGLGRAEARTVAGALPWTPDAADPPSVDLRAGVWLFFTPEEGALVEAIVDRLIPADALSPGGKECGCAVYLDRQLAGGYGRADGLYMRPPFHEGLPTQGPQSALTPAERYRKGLGALAAHVAGAAAGKGFGQLPAEQQDALLTALEKGELDGASGKMFFELLWMDVKQGFFADPVYGGNRGMAAWRMIGFPGARYDYRDWVSRHDEAYPLPPVGIRGRPEWVEGKR